MTISWVRRRWSSAAWSWSRTMCMILCLSSLLRPIIATGFTYGKPEQNIACSATGACDGVARCDTRTMLCRCPMNGLADDGTFHGESWSMGNVTMAAPCDYYVRQVVDTWKCDLFMFHGIVISVILLVLSCWGACRIWSHGRRVTMQLFAAAHIFLYALFYFIHYARDPSAENRDYTESYLLSYSPDLFLIALHNATLCYLRDLTNEAREVRSAGKWTTTVVFTTIAAMELLLVFFGPNQGGLYFVIVAIFMALSACYSLYLGRRLQRQLGTNKVTPISHMSLTKQQQQQTNGCNGNNGNGIITPHNKSDRTPTLAAMKKDVRIITIAPIAIGVAAAVAAVNDAASSNGTHAMDQLASPTQQFPTHTPTGRLANHTNTNTARHFLSPTITQAQGGASGNGGNESKLPDDNESKLPSQSPGRSNDDKATQLTVGEIAGMAALAASMSPHDYDNNGSMISPASGGRAGGGGGMPAVGSGRHHHSIATLRTGGGSVGHTIMSGGAELQAAHTTLTNGGHNTLNNDVLSSSGDSTMTSMPMGDTPMKQHRVPMASVSKGGRHGMSSHRATHTVLQTENNNGNAATTTMGDDGNPPNNNIALIQPGGVNGTGVVSIIQRDDVVDDDAMILSRANGSIAKGITPVISNGNNGNGSGTIRTATPVTMVKKSAGTHKPTTIRVAPSSSTGMDGDAIPDHIQRQDAQQQIRHRVWLFTTGSTLCAAMDLLILLGGMAYMWNHRLYERSLLVFTIWRTNQLLWVLLLLKTFWPRTVGTRGGANGGASAGMPPQSDRIPSIFKRAAVAAGRIRAAMKAAIPRSPTPAQRQAYAAELALGAGGSSGVHHPPVDVAGAAALYHYPNHNHHQNNGDIMHYNGMVYGNGAATSAALHLANYHAPQNQPLPYPAQYNPYYGTSHHPVRVPITDTNPNSTPAVATMPFGVFDSIPRPHPHAGNIINLSTSSNPSGVAQQKVEAWMMQHVDHNHTPSDSHAHGPSHGHSHNNAVHERQAILSQQMLHHLYATQAAAVAAMNTGRRVAAGGVATPIAATNAVTGTGTGTSSGDGDGDSRVAGVSIYATMPATPRGARTRSGDQLPGMITDGQTTSDEGKSVKDITSDTSTTSGPPLPVDDDLPTHRIMTRDRPPLTLLPPIPSAMLQSLPPPPSPLLPSVAPVPTLLTPITIAPMESNVVTKGDVGTPIMIATTPSLPMPSSSATTGAIGRREGNSLVLFSQSPSVTPSSHIYGGNGNGGAGGVPLRMTFSASSNHSGASPSGSPSIHTRHLSPPQPHHRRAMLPMAPSNSVADDTPVYQPLPQQQHYQPSPIIAAP